MKHINQLENILQQHFNYHKSRIKFISSFVLSLIKVKTVCLSDISLSLNENAKEKSNYRRIQDFFLKFSIDYEQLAQFVVSLLPKDIKFILSMDRTNWQFGKKDINILMLGIVYRDTSIPFMWEMLNKRGNSSTEERQQLMERALKVLGIERIKSLVADREFVGKQWLKYLNDSDIEYHIRIKKDAVIQKYMSTIMQVKDLFSYNKQYSYVIIPHKKLIYSQEVYVSGNRTRNGDYFILISNKNPGDALHEYRQRWTIENLFGYLKSKGFNFEETHITHPEKIKKLIALITIAFEWSYLVGVWIEESIKIKIKNHGRKEISIFRKGFDHLRSVIMFIDEKLNQFNFLVNFLSCT